MLSITVLCFFPLPALSRSQVSFVLPAEVDTEVRSGQFVGPIQYRIWKHMKSCLYPSTLVYIIRYQTQKSTVITHCTQSVSACRYYISDL